jgi:hypothetical protein
MRAGRRHASAGGEAGVLQERLTSASAPHLNFPAENNATLARVARNGGTTVDGAATPAPPRLVQGAHVY